MLWLSVFVGIVCGVATGLASAIAWIRTNGFENTLNRWRKPKDETPQTHPAKRETQQPNHNGQYNNCRRCGEAIEGGREVLIRHLKDKHPRPATSSSCANDVAVPGSPIKITGFGAK